jgi:hypothetical protein
VRTNVEDQDGRSLGQAATQGSTCALEARVAELERQVVTLTAALDAASRMQVATPPRLLNQDIRLVGGRLVRRILEKGRLVEDYRDRRRAG